VSAEAFARLNQHRLIGIAHMENDQALNALPEFEAIAKAEPELGFGWVNAAAALLRITDRQKTTIEAAGKGVERLPKAALPRMVLAKAYQNASQPEKATEQLEAAVRNEPENPRALGALIQHLQAQPGDHAAHLQELRKRLADVAPDNYAAQVEWMRAQVEAKDYPGALATLERIQEILPRLPAQAREPVALAKQKMAAGSADADFAARSAINTMRDPIYFNLYQNLIYGNSQDPADLVMRDWGTPPPALPEPALKDVTVTWREVTGDPALRAAKVQGLAPLAVGDVDLSERAGSKEGVQTVPIQDRPDLVSASPTPATLVNTTGGFRGTLPPSAAPASPLLADLNNDFALDLYVAAPAGDRLWASPRAGTRGEAGVTFTTGQAWKPAAAPPGAGPGVPLAVDLDQDGDLDIVRPSGAPGQPAVRYLRNNGNLTFTDLTVAAGLSLPSGGARQAAFGDFDSDGDPDLFVVRSEGGSQLFLNQRQDTFKKAGAEWGIPAAPGARAAAVADIDHDGDWDLAVAGAAPHGSVLYRNEGGRFATAPDALQALGEAEWLQFLDYDNDTWQDLVAAGRSGVKLLRNDRGKFSEGGTVLEGPATWVKPLDYDLDGDLDLLAVAGGAVRLFSNEGGNARPWMKVELQGLLLAASPTPGQQTQANNSYAIGAEIEPRTLWDQPKLLVTEPLMHVGLGRADRAVTLRTLWTHGVPQNRIAPPPGAVVHFDQKPQGSCPFLYTWDGEKWRFGCDFNWKSPIGMLFARGAPVPHDQTLDWVKLAGEQVKPAGSYYPIIATEELREISYFDMLKLMAVDHPGDTEIYVDERFRMGPPAPFRIYTARNRRLPVSAADGSGKDLRPALEAVDNVYTSVPAGPYRGVCLPHDLVLDLGAVPDLSNVKLFLNGWIYPAGTSVNVAAAQNPDVRIIPPTLYVGDGRGGWKETDRNVGLICGKRKTMVLDLSGKLVPGDHRVKLTTTMEIRWDAAFFTSGEDTAPFRRAALPLAEAELRERGYGRGYREVADGPDLFDYNRLLTGDHAPEWPDIAGAYTRLGDCAPLLEEVDDRYAIVAPGDEIRMLFDGRSLPSLPAGWKRDFVFLSDGWTKDTDKNTVAGETVGPLPFHGMKKYPYGPDERFPDTPAHRQWIREWNTRLKPARPARLSRR
jgi:hypothetical protein